MGIVLRYIVPFEFSDDERIKDIINDSNENNDSNKWTIKKVTNKEKDIYTHIYNSISRKENDEIINENSLGIELEYKKIKNDNKVKKNKKDNKVNENEKEGREAEKNECNEDKEGCFYERTYKYFVKEDLSVYFGIENVGAYLFYSNVGFIWYEIRIENNNLRLNDIIEFQNQIKELSYTKSISIKVENNEKESIKEKKIKFPRLIVKSTKEKETAENIPIYDGNIDEYWELEKVVKKENNERDVIIECKKCIMGDVITELLVDLFRDKNSFEYFVPRKSKANNVRPDKAILYSYYCIDDMTQQGNVELEKSVYYLAKGYKASYQVDEDIVQDFYKPFVDDYIYTSKEGCARIALTCEENKGTYNAAILSRMKEDYFILYILLLYQSYTLVHFSKRISLEISADTRKYLKEDNTDSLYEKLKQLDKDIHVFLLNSVHSSVSYVHHHNELYQYIEKRLFIRDDVESITMGIESLKKIEEKYLQKKEEKKAEKINKALNMLSLLAVFSALIDGTDFADKISGFIKMVFVENNIVIDITHLLRYIINGVVVIIVICIAIICMKSLISNKRNRKMRKSD